MALLQSQHLLSPSTPSSRAHAPPVPSALATASTPCRITPLAPTRTPRRASRGGLASTVQPRATQQQERPQIGADSPIENLSRNYCDDFQCTSSPAVEQTVRTFVSSILSRRPGGLLVPWCQPDYKYTDGIRSFEGREKLNRVSQPWHLNALSVNGVPKPIIAVYKMQMLDEGTAQIEWQMQGNLGPVPVQIPIITVIKMNLLTGRITEHRDNFDLSRCSPPAALAVNAARLNWALRESSMDTRNKLKEKWDEIMPKDSSGPSMYSNPTDPTRFYQNPNQPDQGFQEGLALATLAAVLWLVFQTYAELEKIKF